LEKDLTKDMTGVVLAAGKGSRIAQLPTMLPKAVLPVLGEPIIFRQLRTMVSLGIKKCYVVVGHLGYAVVREIERLPNPGIEIEYIEQEQALGIAHSVGRLEPHINGPFMLFLGDIYLRAPKIAEMLRVFSQGNIHGVLGGIKESRTEIIRRNFCIVADESGRVAQVLEKPSQPISDLKGVGVYVFDTNIFDAIKRTPRTAMRNEYEITHSIQILIDNGHDVRVSLSIEKDLNLTYPEDLLLVNLQLLHERGQQNLLCDGSTVGRGTELLNTVVGMGASIGKDSLLHDCVVFGGVTIADGEKLKRAIVTDAGVYKVRPM
jgi:dTDP-glucose pyrophosphorylase